MGVNSGEVALQLIETCKVRRLPTFGGVRISRLIRGKRSPQPRYGQFQLVIDIRVARHVSPSSMSGPPIGLIHNEVMSMRAQTSVRLSQSAVQALHERARSRGESRDATAAALIAGFVEHQRERDEDHRDTHISTVLAYPRCLPRPDQPRTHKVSIRVERDLLHAAAALAYRIPGRSRGRGHADYASRPVTDALVTGLALAAPYLEPELKPLPPLLTWAQANGLWRLVVAATLTQTERRLYRDAPRELVELLKDGDVIWHSEDRCAVALVMANQLFTGEDAAENLTWVGEQRQDFLDWVENLSHPDVTPGGHQFTDGAPTRMSNAEGRAATAAWRAQRHLALEALATWLTGESKDPFTITPPGWTVRQPPGWNAVRIHPLRPLPPSVRAAVDAGDVLRLNHESTSVLWPVAPQKRPVPGVRDLIVGARQLHLTDIEIAEALLIRHEPWAPANDDETQPDPHPAFHPYMPPVVAYEAGLITEQEQRRRERRAAREQDARMAEILRQAAEHPRDKDVLAALTASQGNATAFAKIARENYYRFRPYPPTWSWRVSSVEEILALPATSAQRVIRGREWARHIRLDLDRDMHAAWRAAYWYLRPPPKRRR